MENLTLNADTLRALGTGIELAAEDEGVCWSTCGLTLIAPEGGPTP